MASVRRHTSQAEQEREHAFYEAALILEDTCQRLDMCVPFCIDCFILRRGPVSPPRRMLCSTDRAVALFAILLVQRYFSCQSFNDNGLMVCFSFM